jgi:hypothetical protein
VRHIEGELAQCVNIPSLLRGIEDFNANQAASLVVIDDDAVGYFLAAFDFPASKIEIDGIRLLVDSHAHGFLRSK